MRIQVSEPLPLPADEVFHLLRDDMTALVPYLYDIESIVVAERTEEGDQVHLVNVWQGDTTKIPGAVQKFVKKDVFSWTDYATWTGDTRSATWRLEPRVGSRAFECSGTTSIASEGETSRLEMDIELDIHPENVPGVPSFLARKFRPQIESAIERQIAPNMRNLAVSIRRYAEAKG